MKAFITATMMILGLAVFGLGQNKESLNIKMGQQKSAVRSPIRITFVSVLNDSRCPMNAKCITAGNAEIRVRIWSRRSGSKEFKFNTTMGPKGDEFDGYDISLVQLSPDKILGPRGRNMKYSAEFSIVRLRR